MVSRKDGKGPSLRFVDDRNLIEILAETDNSEFNEKLNQLTKKPPASKISSPSVSTKKDDQVGNEVISWKTGNICNEADWCSISTSRLLAQTSDYKPCGLNFSFHLASITHRMLNVYENEEETDLHDVLSKEDLVILSRHQSDEDIFFTLIFQPKYPIRPTSKMVLNKINEFTETKNMGSEIQVLEDGDFFADAWMKSNPFHGICKEEPKPSTSKKSKKKKKN